MSPKTTQSKTIVTPAAPKQRYHEGVGGRKTAVARARMYKGKGSITVNGKAINEYFKMQIEQEKVTAPLVATGMLEEYWGSVHVRGGGIVAQAEAVRHGIALALVASDETFKKILRAKGFMTRDPRVVERKKPGLKKARKAPQWAKR